MSDPQASPVLPVYTGAVLQVEDIINHYCIGAFRPTKNCFLAPPIFVTTTILAQPLYHPSTVIIKT
jgi:hypothetical protein